jgi:sarcosine oxidase, subunit gamma
MVEQATRRVPKTPAADWLRTLPPAARFVFHGGAEARAAAVSAWGPAFSDEACRANAHPPRATLWLGPDEYLLLDMIGSQPTGIANASASRASLVDSTSGDGSDNRTSIDGPSGNRASIDGILALGATAATTFDAIESAIGAIPHALVDVSHRQFAVEIVGPHAATILSGACPLDLDLSEFPIGMCTRTVLAKADIVLWRKQETVFHVEIWRSFAGYVTGVLGEIASEFYPVG